MVKPSQSAFWQPLPYGQRPVTRKPPSATTARPVRGGEGAGHDGARVAPEQLPADLGREEAGDVRVGGVDLGDPAGGRLGVGERFDHVKLGDRVDLQAADGARREHPADAGVGHGLCDVRGQVALALALVAALADGLEDGARRCEQALGGGLDIGLD